MKQNNLGRFILVLVVVCWSLLEIYPPTSRDLLVEFTSKAQNKDAAFTNILADVAMMQKDGKNISEFTMLETAAGTNDLEKYFPSMSSAANQIKPNLYILNHLQRAAAGKIKLGIDLQGGTAFLVEMDTNVLFDTGTNTTQQSQASVTSAALDQAISVLRTRIDRFGVAEPVIQSAGDNRILIQLPGLSQADKDSAREQILKAAHLEFRLVNDHTTEIVNPNTGQILQPVPPGYEVLKLANKSDNGKPIVISYVVKKTAEAGLSGDIVKSARMGYGNLGQPEVDFELNPAAAIKFGDFTQEYAPQNGIEHSLSIVLDGQLYSVAGIKSAILGGNVSISGGSMTQEEVKSIVNVLQNPLRAPLHIVYSSDVDPTLGKDSIASGIKASIYGVIFVSVFMLCYYWIAGIAANIALFTNIIILLGVMCSVGSTFTLPGIAGAVLTVGMAVDANVLIYERIREELAKGKSLRGAIDAGYARAFGTIFDSHVTTLISSIILIWMGTGEIKGFGVTLTIGVAASLFTALVVTRLIFNFLTDRNLIQSLPMLHIIKSSKVNFMAMAKPLFIITWLFIIVSLGFGITRGSKLFGVDFLGGDSTIYSFTEKVGQEQIRSELDAVGLKDAQIQYQKDIGGSAQNLLVTTASGSADKVVTALENKFPQAHFQLIGKREVGAVVGEEIQRSAVIASLFAMLGILFYVAFRYEFSFAVAAVIAVLHDVLLTIGAFCLANYFSQREFNATVVAAVLTIIGFSINDKIVIFDRIREDLKLGVRGSFKDIINQALNQTLSRTIITSGTVFLATLSLFIFGGGVINDFAFTFLVGIITGTYSSIYIASVLVLWWHKGERPNIGAPATTGGQSVAAPKA